MIRRRISIERNTQNQVWETNQPFLMNLLNTYNILVPDSEKFIIRTVKKFKKDLPEDLNRDVKILFFQEGQHANETLKIENWLKKHYRITFFKFICYWITYGSLEKILPNKLLLSVASAVEHLNTSLSEYFLRNDDVLRTCPEHIRGLYFWHFAEEIEHKSVVFNVHKTISSSHFLKLLGLLFAVPGFLILLSIGSFYLSVQNGLFFTGAFWKDFFYFCMNKKGLLRFWLKMIRMYMASDFHPNDTQNLNLVSSAINTVTDMGFYQKTAEENT